MKAWELLSQPNTWTKHFFALNQYGDACWPNSPDAVCFCVAGAIKRCYPEISERMPLLTKLCDKMHFHRRSLFAWNDSQQSVELIVAILKELDI